MKYCTLCGYKVGKGESELSIYVDDRKYYSKCFVRLYGITFLVVGVVLGLCLATFKFV